MNVIVISNQQVKEVRQDGIVYVDAEGHEQFIDFEACYQTWLTKALNPDHLEQMKTLNGMTDERFEQYIQRLKDPRAKYIADRNILGNIDINGKFGVEGKPYFQFYSNPRVRIEFPNEDKLWEMREKLEHVFKWRTIDLT